jgi:hypothetical protein
VTLDLTARERKQFDKSVAAVKGLVDACKRLQRKKKPAAKAVAGKRRSPAKTGSAAKTRAAGKRRTVTKTASAAKTRAGGKRRGAAKVRAGGRARRAVKK